MALQRIGLAAEIVTCEPSSATQTEIDLPFITEDTDGGKLHLLMTLTRAKLKELVSDLIEETLETCKQTIIDADSSLSDIDKVILVGQHTNMSVVQVAIEEFFVKSLLRGIDPAEVVALGAAVQSGVLTGNVEDVLLADVTPQSFGFETLGGVFTKLIEKNTTIPTRANRVFSTNEDNQKTVEIHVLQGESEMSEFNISLGIFTLSGIPPLAKGVPQIEVTFEIDTNCILHVSAKDLVTGRVYAVTSKGTCIVD